MTRQNRRTQVPEHCRRSGAPSIRPRAALYHRVSTVDQDPTGARHELHEVAKRHGFAVALDIEEIASAANNQRPGLLRVMEAATRGDVDVVLVWKLDRFGLSALASASSRTATPGSSP